MARITSPVIGSRAHSRGMPWRASTRETVRAGTPELGAEPVRAAALPAAQLDDAVLDLGAGPGRAWCAGGEDRSRSPASPSAA